MALTPADVHNIAFSRPRIGKRGYNEQEVDLFIDLVEQELVRHLEEESELRSRNAELRSRDGGLQKREAELCQREAALRQHHAVRGRAGPGGGELRSIPELRETRRGFHRKGQGPGRVNILRGFAASLSSRLCAQARNRLGRASGGDIFVQKEDKGPSSFWT